MSEPHRVEKIMSLTHDDFFASLKHMGAWSGLGGDRYAFDTAHGRAILSFEPLPSARLGGLLDLPRAKVTIELGGIDAAHREAFLKRFDLAFQRGGG